MERRVFLTGVGTSIVVTLAGCLGETSGEDGTSTTSVEGGTPSGEDETSGEDGTSTTSVEGGTPSGEEGTTTTSGEGCKDSLKTSEDDSRFLKEGETPGSPGAEELLATIKKETDGLTWFTDASGTERIGFSERGDTWEIRYRGTPHAGEDQFREEIAVLATTFASNRSDGVSLKATSIHECTTGRWHVCADTAAAYERGELDREAFLDKVYENAEVVSNC